MNTVRRYYPAEVKKRGGQLVFESEARHESQWTAIRSVAEKIGCSTQSLRTWSRQAGRDEGRPALLTERRARLEDLDHEVRELECVNETLLKAAAYSAQAELDRLPS